MKMALLTPLPRGAKEIYFAGGCFWGVEKLFRGIPGVLDAQSGYANGRDGIVPDYEKVCSGKTGCRETVRVLYDPHRVSLEQLLKAYFLVIDPTVRQRQGNDVGDQYQTGIYYADESSGEVVRAYAGREKLKYPGFAVEISPLTGFFPAEEYHQDYLSKLPGGYCHIGPHEFELVRESLGFSEAPVYPKPDREALAKKLSPLEFAVTQDAATERPFTGKYWDFKGKGLYVDITSGEPLFSSLDKYESSCGWPSFSAPAEGKNLEYREDRSHGLKRTEVRSRAGRAHLGHVFPNDPESPSGVRYCINSIALKFIPYEELEAKGYGKWLAVFDEPGK